MKTMNSKQKRQFNRIIIAAIIFAVTLLIPRLGFNTQEGIWQYFNSGLFIITYLIVGLGTLRKAGGNILHGQVFDENFLMSIASLGAMILGDFPEGIAVMLFYQVGELFESYAVDQSRKSISSLMDIRPDYANVMRDGVPVKTDPDDVAIGDIILVNPGEKVPLDGVIAGGSSTLDTSALTGESIPRDAAHGSDIMSGCINLTSPLMIEVTKVFGESTVSKILDLVENASSKKANVEKFITKFARWYTPIVVAVAIIMAIVPPLLIDGAMFSEWIYRALVFLVISCPCALVISIPLSFFGGVGGASKLGVLVKGSNYLEALAHTEVVVFDKTGTLTSGTFTVTEIHCENITSKDGMLIDEMRLLELAAIAENYSNHPISVSIKNAYGKVVKAVNIDDIKEISGHGVEAKIDDLSVYAGNDKLMRQIGVETPEISLAATIVHIAIDNVYAGYLVISDQIKPDAKEAIRQLKDAGINDTVMLTGDRDAIGRQVAEALGLDQVYTELLPANKVEKMETLLLKKSSKGKLVFVGDGINDAPVLARADIGIAMGGLGSEAAIEAADIVIMTDEPSKIPKVIKVSKRTLRIAKQNVIFALGVKAVILVLGAVGVASMWAAVFADVGVAIIAILNAVRALNIKNL